MATPEATPELSHVTSTARSVVVAAGGVVLDDAGGTRRVLIVHRPDHDDWSLPKGHVDPGEDLATAALREVREETGVEARIIGSLTVTEHAVGQAHKRVHWFLMQPCEGAADPQARPSDAEVDRAEWSPLTTAAERLTYANERDLLAAVVDGP